MATQQLSTPRFDFIRFHLCKYMKDINIFSENILLVFLLEFYMDFEPYEKDFNEKTLLFLIVNTKIYLNQKQYMKILIIKYNTLNITILLYMMNFKLCYLKNV